MVQATWLLMRQLFGARKKKKKRPPTVMGGATSAKSLCCFTASREPGDERPNPESVSKVKSVSCRNIIVQQPQASYKLSG